MMIKKLMLLETIGCLSDKILRSEDFSKLIYF